MNGTSVSTSSGVALCIDCDADGYGTLTTTDSDTTEPLCGGCADRRTEDAKEVCSDCGEDLADSEGEGYDGLCGACADRAEEAGRWASTVPVDAEQSVRDRVRVKIMAEFSSARSIEDAAQRAAAREVHKAKQQGWAPRTIKGMVVLFTDVAADMVAEVLNRDLLAPRSDAEEALTAVTSPPPGVAVSESEIQR